MKNFQFLSVPAFIFSLYSCLAFPQAPDVVRDPTRLIFSEECESSYLEKSWIFENGADPRQFVLSSRWRDNVATENGFCRLEQRKQRRAGKEWTSGHMWSKQEFLYGYFEAKVKFGSAAGIDNAFWLMSTDTRQREPGEIRCEIDIVEGAHPNLATNNLHLVGDGRPKASPAKYSNANQYSDEFHTFGLSWTPQEIKWLLDGLVVRTEKNQFCNSPLAVRLSTAVIGGSWGPLSDGVDGSVMEVDYVRVYRQ